MKVTIAGAGNVGTQFAVHCAEQGCEVTLFTSKAGQVQRELSILDETGRVTHRGRICGATGDAERAFCGADLVFVTVPAMLMKRMAGLIEPHIRPGVMIGLIPGTGGGECAFWPCIQKGAVLFGLQRVPSVARLVEYGKTVRAVGYRPKLHAAALPGANTGACCALTEQLLGIKTLPLPNYLTITLTPSNPILHTTRLYRLFRDYRKGMVYKSVPLFYEGWDRESSELLLQCDDELQRLCRALEGFDLSYVRPLREHYESPTAEALTKKLASIPGFKGLKSPVAEVTGGYIPDFQSRYFTADFSYGLCILIQIAGFAGLELPCMQRILDWYRPLAAGQEEFRFSEYGIDSYKAFKAFYSA